MAMKTGTFQKIHYFLSDGEKQCIVDELMQYLNKRRESVSFQIRGVDRHLFQLPQYILGAFQEPTEDDKAVHIKACWTPTEMWDRIWKPSLEANRVPMDEYEFLKRTMPQDSVFTFAQMDLRSANILVKDGHFSGFASESLAGYFPSWFQKVAIAINHYPIELPEDRVDEQEGDLHWYTQLMLWCRDERNQDNPLSDSLWGLHAIRLPNMEYGRWWFEYWYLVQQRYLVQQGRPEELLEVCLSNWRRNIAAITDYVENKHPTDAERVDFLNYMMKTCTIVDEDEKQKPNLGEQQLDN